MDECVMILSDLEYYKSTHKKVNFNNTKRHHNTTKSNTMLFYVEQYR